jgi:NDP-sugar pyrophosphorylase family protein
MTVLRNDNRWDASNARFVPDGEGPSGQVTEYGKGEVNPHHQWIDYGLGMFTAEGFLDASTDTTDLAAVYRRLAERGELAGFEANERFYEIGTAKSLAETDAFLRREASRRAKLPT